MRDILTLILLSTLMACVKETSQDGTAEPHSLANEFKSDKPPAAEEISIAKSSEFTYVGLTIDQAHTAARKKNKRFRVVKLNGIDLPVTFDFVYGRINAKVVDGVVVGASVEGSRKQ